jgi:hypothetical protein
MRDVSTKQASLSHRLLRFDLDFRSDPALHWLEGLGDGLSSSRRRDGSVALKVADWRPHSYVCRRISQSRGRTHWKAPPLHGAHPELTFDLAAATLYSNPSIDYRVHL